LGFKQSISFFFPPSSFPPPIVFFERADFLNDSLSLRPITSFFITFFFHYPTPPNFTSFLLSVRYLTDRASCAIAFSPTDSLALNTYLDLFLPSRDVTSCYVVCSQFSFFWPVSANVIPWFHPRLGISPPVKSPKILGRAMAIFSPPWSPVPD